MPINSLYYVANVVKNKIWFVNGSLKNEDHWVFIRTLDSGEQEFFVSPSFEEEFLYMIEVFTKKGLITEFRALPNRLI